MGGQFTIKVSGIKEMMKNLDPRLVEKEIDKVAETYARKMANSAAMKAPRRDSYLKNSLTASPKREEFGTWSWGSDLPYARRQEYEHATQRGFVRTTIYEYRQEYRDAIKILLKGLGG